MNNWFLSKVTYEKLLENGMQKKVTEPYLVDAMSWTEAEARTIEEIKPYITGEFTIADISRAKLSEIFLFENGDRFFKAKVMFVSLDEKSGTEKETPTNMLVQASNPEEALKVLDIGMKGTIADYKVASMTETKIVDIFPYGEVKPKTVVFPESK